jgi:hypothetical protein
MIHDNIFIERLWHTVKYEEVYLDYESIREEKRGLKDVFPVLQRGTVSPLIE